jgi:hypothetical protein
MSEQLEQTKEWLAGVAAEGLSRVELVANLDKGLVREWRWPQGDQAANDSINLDERARDIVRTAERDGQMRAAKDVGYLVQAYRCEDQGGAFFAKHGLRVPGASASKNGTTGLPDNEEYPASALGLAQLSIKSTEVFAKLLIQSNEGRTTSLEHQIEALTRRDEENNQRLVKTLRLIEDLTTARAEREALEQQMRLAERKDAWLQDKLDKLAPIALNRLFGGGPGTGKLFAGEELVRQFFGSLDASVIDGMAKGQAVTLTPEQVLIAMEIFSTYAQREEARQRALNGGPGKATAAPTNGTAEKESPQ